METKPKGAIITNSHTRSLSNLSRAVHLTTHRWHFLHELAQVQHLIDILGIAATHHRNRIDYPLFVVKDLVGKELGLLPQNAQTLGNVRQELLEGHDNRVAHFQAVKHFMGQTQVTLSDCNDVVGEGATVPVRVLLHGDAEEGCRAVLGLQDGEGLAEVKLLGHSVRLQVVEAIW